jgi:hypothetical protein
MMHGQKTIKVVYQLWSEFGFETDREEGSRFRFSKHCHSEICFDQSNLCLRLRIADGAPPVS